MYRTRRIAIFFGMFTCVLPLVAIAGVFSGVIEIEDVSAPQAFRGELSGGPARYAFRLPAQRPVYLNLLIPDENGARKDFLIEVLSERGARYAMNGAFFSAWSPFRDARGASYLKGPEITPTLYPGAYTLSVSNNDNHGTYILAVSGQPGFPGETRSAGIVLFFLRAKLAAAGIAVLAAIITLYTFARRRRERYGA